MLSPYSRYLTFQCRELNGAISEKYCPRRIDGPNCYKCHHAFSVPL